MPGVRWWVTRGGVWRVLKPCYSPSVFCKVHFAPWTYWKIKLPLNTIQQLFKNTSFKLWELLFKTLSCHSVKENMPFPLPEPYALSLLWVSLPNGLCGAVLGVTGLCHSFTMSLHWQHSEESSCLTVHQGPRGEEINRLRILCPHSQRTSHLALPSADPDLRLGSPIQRIVSEKAIIHRSVTCKVAAQPISILLTKSTQQQSLVYKAALWSFKISSHQWVWCNFGKSVCIYVWLFFMCIYLMQSKNQKHITVS